MEWKSLIRRHESWLATYYALAKFTGWILIFFGIFNLIGGGYMAATGRVANEHFFFAVLIMPFTDGILPGLLALVAAGFLRYLLNPEKRIEFFLVMGDKVLYLGAAVYLAKLFVMCASFPKYYHLSGGLIDILNPTLMVVVPNVLLQVAKILIAVGLAQALRRMLSMINEAKTLV